MLARGRCLIICAVAAVHTVPPAISMKAARDEAEMVLFECVKEALARSGLKPRQVSLPALYRPHLWSVSTSLRRCTLANRTSSANLPVEAKGGCRAGCYVVSQCSPIRALTCIASPQRDWNSVQLVVSWSSAHCKEACPHTYAA